MCMQEVHKWTDELMSLRELGIVASEEGFKEYDIEEGTVMGWTLYKDKNVHCIRSYISKEAIFPLHEHEFSAETLVLYSGAVDVEYVDEGFGTKVQSLEIGVPFYLKSQREHKLISRAESRMIAIFIPPDEDIT